MPHARTLRPALEPPPSDLALPAVVKPMTRGDGRWAGVDSAAKAARVDTLAALRRLWPGPAALDVPVLAQELVPGPETRIEPDRVDVDADLGRHVVEALGLRGVAKVDLKRGPDGRLRLLEVDPRAAGIPTLRWAAWAARSPARSTPGWEDPLPVVRVALHRADERLGG